MIELTSRRLKVASPDAATAFLYEKGWTDGLPVVAPTPERVEAMLAGTWRKPDELIGLIPPAQGKATIEKIAINAVLAGCLPAYLPVVITAIEAMVEPPFVLARVQATTNPVAPLAVVNGPIRNELDINCGHNALGQGRQSNATIGRAIRLIMTNIGGAIPGITDMATLGQSAKYTFCLGENEEGIPKSWPALHVEKGFPASASTVSVFGAVSILNILDMESKSAEGVLTTIAGSMTGQGGYNMNFNPGEPLVILSPEHAAIMAQEGMSKDDVRRALCEKAAIPLSSFGKEQSDAMVKKWHRPVVNGMVHISDHPEDLQLFVAGGMGPHSAFAPTFSSKCVTKEIGK